MWRVLPVPPCWAGPSAPAQPVKAWSRRGVINASSPARQGCGHPLRRPVAPGLNVGWWQGVPHLGTSFIKQLLQEHALTHHTGQSDSCPETRTPTQSRATGVDMKLDLPLKTMQCTQVPNTYVLLLPSKNLSWMTTNICQRAFFFFDKQS